MTEIQSLGPWSLLNPGVALAAVDANLLRESAVQFEVAGDVCAAEELHAACTAALQVQHANSNRSGGALAAARARAAIRIMSQLGYRGSALSRVQTLTRAWTAHELNGAAHNDMYQLLAQTARDAAFDDTGEFNAMRVALMETWPDVVRESTSAVKPAPRPDVERSRGVTDRVTGRVISQPTTADVLEQIARLGKGVLAPAYVDDDGHPLMARSANRFNEMMGHPIHALQFMLPPNAALPDGSSFRGSTGVVPVWMETEDRRVALLMSTFHKGVMLLQWATFPGSDPAVDEEVGDWLMRFEYRD